MDDMRAEWGELDDRIAALDEEFAARARSDASARLLATIPGNEAFQSLELSRCPLVKK